MRPLLSQPGTTLFRMLALAGLAGVGALLSNALQPPSRRLPWSEIGRAHV